MTASPSVSPLTAPAKPQTVAAFADRQQTSDSTNQHLSNRLAIRNPLLFELRVLLLRLREAFADGWPPCAHRNRHKPLAHIEKCWDCGRVRRMYAQTYSGGQPVDAFFGAWHKEDRQ